MRLREHERKISEMLAEARADSPGLCARLLLCFVLNISPERYIFHLDDELSPHDVSRLRELVLRRAAGEPLAYILGRKDFYEHTFIVSAATLTPRPETELLVDLALRRMPAGEVFFVDAGCGSGCIGLSLLAQRPAWRGLLLDISLSALHIASLNAVEIAPSAGLLQADIFHFPVRDAQIDLLISNPPYIGREELDSVMPEVLAYEPHGALFSGNRGFRHIEALASLGMRVLKPGGLLLFEHGSTQAAGSREILEKAGFADMEEHCDLAGLPRCAAARKP